MGDVGNDETSEPDYNAWLNRSVTTFQRGKSPVEVNFRRLVPKLKPGADRYTHLVHPYPAKLIPAIPYLFLRCTEIAAPGSIVLDPFCGSGTVLLEAALAGHRAAGADSNPLARLIAGAKLTRAAPAALQRHLVRIIACSDEPGALPDVVNVEHWFHPEVISRLSGLRAGIAAINDPAIRRLFEVCLSACARRVSYADPRLSVPVRLNPDRRHIYGAKGNEAMRRLDNVTGAHVLRVFHTICNQNIERVRRLSEAIPRAIAPALYDDARHLPIASGTVDLVITSPPYVGAQKYVRASTFGLGWLGLAPGARLRPIERLSIGREHYARAEYLMPQTTSVPAADEVLADVRARNPLRAHIASNYLVEMDAALAETARVVRRGGWLVLVAGQNLVCGERFDTPSFLEVIAQHHGFRTRLRLLDDIQSRGLMTKRNRTASIIGQEVIIVMNKHA